MAYGNTLYIRQAFWLTSLYLMLQHYWTPPAAPANDRDGVCAVLAVFAQLFMTQAGIVYAASCEQGAHDAKKVHTTQGWVIYLHTHTPWDI